MYPSAITIAYRKVKLHYQCKYFCSPVISIYHVCLIQEDDLRKFLLHRRFFLSEEISVEGKHGQKKLMKPRGRLVNKTRATKILCTW